MEQTDQQLPPSHHQAKWAPQDSQPHQSLHPMDSTGQQPPPTILPTPSSIGNTMHDRAQEHNVCKQSKIHLHADNQNYKFIQNQAKKAICGGKFITGHIKSKISSIMDWKPLSACELYNLSYELSKILDFFDISSSESETEVRFWLESVCCPFVNSYWYFALCTFLDWIIPTRYQIWTQVNKLNVDSVKYCCTLTVTNNPILYIIHSFLIYDFCWHNIESMFKITVFLSD